MAARLAALIGAILLVLPAAAVAAPSEVVHPAPPAESSATAAEVEGVVAVGDTSASADEESGEAQGHAVSVGDEPLAEETGGSQSGQGTAEGAVVDSGETELGELQVTPWRASVEEGEDERTAESDAALARVTVIDADVARAEVLGSESAARHTDGRSSAEAESRGADVMVGGDEGLRVIVLRAFTSSEGQGGAALLTVNDTEIGTSEQADGQCELDIPELVRLLCLTAEGGAAESGIGTESAAGVLLADTREELPGIGIVQTTSAGADAAPAAVPAGPAPAAPAQVETAAAPAPAPASIAGPAPAATLAQTGFGTSELALTALALLLLGGLTIAHARIRLAPVRA